MVSRSLGSATPARQPAYPFRPDGAAGTFQAVDVVINLEEDLGSAQTAVAVCATPANVLGFTASDGIIAPAAGCEAWFAMSRLGGDDRDRLKRSNRHTHSEILRDIAQLPRDAPAPRKPQLHLTLHERIEAERWRHSVTSESKLLGVATWAGDIWLKETVGRKKLISILSAVRAQLGPAICVLPSWTDEEDGFSVAAAAKCAFAEQTSLRGFAARISQCDVILCADSLALHIANALDVPKVVLVGPTSSAELDLFGCGTAITSNLPCLGCYLRSCEVDPDCMESLDENMIIAAIKHWLSTTTGKGSMSSRKSRPGSGNLAIEQQGRASSCCE